MAANVDKRVNYFDGQFLKADDFMAEQEYNIDRQRAHQQLFHTSGIAGGLGVTANGGASEAVVDAGVAVDGEGRQIVLSGERMVDLRSYADQTVLLLISYDEEQADTAAVGNGNTRWHERPRVEATAEDSAPPSDTHIRLGRIVVSSSGTVNRYDDTVRINAGGRLGDEVEVRKLTISRSRVDPTRWPTLTSGASGRVDLAGGLSITGDVGVGRNLTVTGNVSIGALDSRSTLQVQGTIALGAKGEDWTDIQNTDRALHFQAKGADPDNPNLAHTGGRIYSTSTEAGWNNQALVLEAGQIVAGSDAASWAPNQLTLKGDGNVGVGTGNPGAKLDVAGDIHAGNSDLYFTKTDHNHTGFGNTPGYAAIENASNYDALMILGRAGTTKGRYVRLWDYLQVNGGLDITGDVGIGTSSPAAKLDVNGGFKAASNDSGDRAILMEPPGGGDHRNSGTQAATGLVYRVQENPDSGDPIFQVRSSGEAVRLFVEHDGWTGSKDNSAWFGGSKDNFFSGNVGIGTTEPAEALEVNGRTKSGALSIGPWPAGAGYVFFGTNTLNQAEAGNYALLQDSTDGGTGRTFLNSPVDIRFRISNADKMILLNNGNVGMGTASPDRALTIQGAGSTFLNVKANDGDYQVLLGADSSGGIISTTTNHDLQLRAGRNSTKMTIKASGNVGIGTGSPGAKLDVAGDIHAGNSDLYFTKTDHNHTGFGNTTGYAAIENAANYDALMILGRAGTTKGRYVRLWDYLQVNGGFDVTGASILKQQDWQTPTMENGWVRYSSTYNAPGYFKDSMGIVHLRGMIKSGTIGRHAFTLPSGYRPARRELMATLTNGNVASRLDVLTNGQVDPYSGSNRWVSLDGLTFRAA